MVVDVAKRCRKGESLTKLAAEYGVSGSNLWTVLREKCGDTWKQTFKCKRLNIHEVVEIPIPRLLDEKTIRAVAQYLDAKRTNLHRPPKTVNDYLLSGFIFCSGCARTLSGATNMDTGIRYYRHAHKTHTLVNQVPTPCPFNHIRQSYVRAYDIEQSVLNELFDLMGNPAAIERAVTSAVPNNTEAHAKKTRLDMELQRIAEARDDILNLIQHRKLTRDQAAKKLDSLQKRESLLRQEQGSVEEQLANTPSPDELRLHVEEIIDSMGTGKSIFLMDAEGNTYAGGNDVLSRVLMSGQDKRYLVESAFRMPLPGGASGLACT
jgi:hypothetical protein